jgi:hypothetical protein
VDAYVRYRAEIEADNPEEAVSLARSSDDVGWEEHSIDEFDADSVVALDAEGEPIPETEVGRLAPLYC